MAAGVRKVLDEPSATAVVLKAVAGGHRGFPTCGRAPRVANRRSLPPRKLLKRSALPLDWASSEKSGGHRFFSGQPNYCPNVITPNSPFA